MTSISLEWLEAEAANQGLLLTDDDLAAIKEQLDRLKAALKTSRPTETERPRVSS